MITIVDYGMGNLGSITNMFKYIGVSTKISSDPADIQNAEKLLLPGVGAFDEAMNRINQSGIKEILDKKVLDEKIPILGICLGMQLLTNSSEEGMSQGLGWIDAETLRFPKRKDLKVPHMGWNVVSSMRDSPITNDFPKEESRFYFVHSYYVSVKNEDNSLLKTTYGLEFDSAIQKNNIIGAQFHPEKSHKFGMIMFANFARL